MRAYLSAANGSPVLAPTTEGLRALGYSVAHGIPSVWRPADGPFDVDLLITTGMRKPHAEARRLYEARGIPWLSFDMPHVRGVAGDVRLYAEGHHWLPDVDGLPSRRGRLPVAVTHRVLHEPEAVPAPKGRKPTTSKGKAAARAKAKEAKADAQAVADAENEAENEAGYVLVIGQMPHDSSHGMDVPGLVEWSEGVFAAAREALPGVEVVWRRHPISASVVPKGHDRNSDPHQETIAAAIAGARLVCVYSSTVGLEALIAGKPVVAWGPSCYSDLCAKPGEIATATHPGVEAVEALLERVAYTQWSLEELATGEPFRFVLEQMGIKCDSVS